MLVKIGSNAKISFLAFAFLGATFTTFLGATFALGTTFLSATFALFLGGDFFSTLGVLFFTASFLVTSLSFLSL